MSGTTSPVKRPRLSLQIKAISNGSSVRTSRAVAATVDPKSPTAFNTLSNVYVTAIDRSTATPSVPEPVTAIHLPTKPRLQLQTQCQTTSKERRINTPYVGTFPETPLTAQPLSPAVMAEMAFLPSTMTATPPLSAGPVEPGVPVSFTIDTVVFPSASTAALEDRTPLRRTTFPLGSINARLAPYNHPRALHSILRNSPLPPPTAKTPLTPRRQSLRLQEKAARRVGYNSPLEQTIITNTYTRSHIDLLREDLSPFSPPTALEDIIMTPATAFESYETRDGGETPGPFEEMRRRMAGLGTSTPISPAPGSAGVRKRKKKEKKRRWVWTIGQEDEDENSRGAAASSKAAQVAAAIMRDADVPAALVAPSPRPASATKQHRTVTIEPPTPSVESSTGLDSIFEGPTDDVAMSDTTSIVSDLDREKSPADMDLDLETPIATRRPHADSGISRRDRLGSVDLFNPDTGSRRDTPVPELLAEQESCA